MIREIQKRIALCLVCIELYVRKIFFFLYFCKNFLQLSSNCWTNETIGKQEAEESPCQTGRERAGDSLNSLQGSATGWWGK